MDSRQLAYFRRTVESGSMSAAASVLGIAQPSLSQQIRNLETGLGVALLLRTARGVVPTEAGQILYDHACRIAGLLAAAEAEVRAVGSEPTGRVEFGMPASVSMALSIPLAETIRVEMPSVQFCAIEAMSGHIKELVTKGDIDLALLYDQEAIGDCTSDLVLTEDLWFYSAPDAWPLPTPPGQPVPLGAVTRLDLVLPSRRHGLRTLIDRITRQERLRTRIVTEMDSLQQIKALVARGSCQTILSQAAVHDLVEIGRLAGSPIVEPRIRRPVYVVRSTGRRATAATQAIEAYCREVIRDLVRRGIWQAEFPSGRGESA
ncbi:LysR substrate-binding domain-containing protein [Jiella sonneratiae]|uniref:LysR family transcriptional regulator n=1 Tax=Jiella sonneratiae TaxID=2816856 RepID=A0ABS3IZ31_9HYPH|nr:LysR substrate-binding domain-containing protein [Jiella sonneratiae]MBO0902170.1 LysR family transcriptional regulator [Jiella sonneratiae]